jgi:hypothetical protein
MALDMAAVVPMSGWRWEAMTSYICTGSSGGRGFSAE